MCNNSRYFLICIYMIVYIDGIFDLFHYGHLNSFKQCKDIGENIYLIVGIIGDGVAEKYKRRPIIEEKYRYEIIKNLKLVDEIVENPPLVVTKEFMDKYKIDLVVHGFSNPDDSSKQGEFFEYPKSINKFKEIQYYSELSTTDIINSILNM